jgi:Domain of unknown function (DUF4405)
MTLCVASGILISRVALPELRISLPLDDPFWDRAHTLTAEVTLGLVPVHVALRCRWIASVGPGAGLLGKYRGASHREGWRELLHPSTVTACI